MSDSSNLLGGYAGGVAFSTGSVSNLNGKIRATAIPSSNYTGGGSSSKTPVDRPKGLETPTLIACVLVIGAILYFASKR